MGRRTQAQLDVHGKRRCSACQRVKYLTDFYRDARGRSGRGYRCKDCVKTATSAHNASDPERKRQRDAEYRRNQENRARTRQRRLRQKYGISADEYDRLLASQGGGCAICGGVETDSRSRELPVDHDHATGAVRGILCDPCNRVLGLFGDDPATVRRAVRYLRKWGRRP